MEEFDVDLARLASGIGFWTGRERMRKLIQNDHLGALITALNADLQVSTVRSLIGFLLEVGGAYGIEYMANLVESYCQSHKDASLAMETANAGFFKWFKNESRHVAVMAETLMKIQIANQAQRQLFASYAYLFLLKLIPVLEFVERHAGAPQMLALSVCIADGYLVPTNESRRFWAIVMRLPYDLQGVVAARVCGNAGTLVPWSEAALSWALL